jgi:para-aminobenzoate synthetase component I
MIPPHASPTPRVLTLDAPPDEVAARLRALPGLIWLDTAGHRPESDPGGGISIITAAPRAVLTGNLSDPAPLESALAGLCSSTASQVDWGFPLSGLFGWVGYKGDYTFGVYDEVLIYRHATGEWIATGPLLPQAIADAQVPPPPPPLVFSPDGTRAGYESLVRRAQEYITAGDIYQVNLAHRFSAAWPESAEPLALALALRAASPAPYAAYLDLAGQQIISSSPESFLKISGSHIRTRPIKGTRPRCLDPEADERSAIELIRSEKERAELLMITDLLRSDLGQVCEYGSVRVTDLLKLETYEQVFHLVSTIQGQLRPDVSHIAALRACSPGGSITGAPKKRATEIIAELEVAPRGVYTGAIGYFGANGESQFSIAIRTIHLQDRRATFHVGAGIVADSDPALEWQETLHKAAGILAASQARGRATPVRLTVPSLSLT